MKRGSLRRQAAVLSLTGALVRALGFLLHVAMGRLLGAEALGVAELAHNAHMLSVAPITAGLPLAVSREAARRRDGAALCAGRSLALRAGLPLAALWLALAPRTARLLGSADALPALLAFAPGIPALGLCAVYSGYCYGRGRVWPPALGTLCEQLARFALSAALLLALPSLALPARAAVPALAESAAALCGLGMTALLLRRAEAPEKAPPDPALRRELLRLSAPLAATRLLQTLLRAALGAAIPLRLTAGGMRASQATAAYGMLAGMAMPVLFLPGIVTGALGMVGAPAIARSGGERLRQNAAKLLAASLACGLGGALGARLLAGFLANTVYRVPELRGLLRAAAPIALLLALQQACATLLTGLGEQKRTLPPTLVGAAVTLLLAWRWAASPLGVEGAVYAEMLGRAAALLWELCEVARLLFSPTGSAATAGP